jgi:hypothetical protein
LIKAVGVGYVENYTWQSEAEGVQRYQSKENHASFQINEAGQISDLRGQPLTYIPDNPAVESRENSEWNVMPDGVYQLKTYVGQSEEGFHPGLEVSRLGGDSEGINWGLPVITIEEARTIASGLESAWDIGVHDEILHPSAGRDLWEDAPEPEHVSTLSESSWRSISMDEEVKEYIGRSEDGYHFAVEYSQGGGDNGDYELPWSGPYQTREEAETAMNARVKELEGVGHENEIAWEDQQIANFQQGRAEAKGPSQELWTAEAVKHIQADLAAGTPPEQIVDNLTKWRPERGDENFFKGMVQSAMTTEQREHWTPNITSVDAPSLDKPERAASPSR